MSSCPATESNTQPQVPKSNAIGEVSEEHKTITS